MCKTGSGWTQMARLAGVTEPDNEVKFDEKAL